MDQSLSLKRKTVEQILVEPIDDEGNPLVLYGLYAEEQQRSFDSTCGNSPVPKPVTSLTPVRLTHKFPRRVGIQGLRSMGCVHPGRRVGWRGGPLVCKLWSW